MIRIYQAENNIESEYLFVNKRGERISPHAVLDAEAGIAKKIGVPTGIHACRKSINQNVYIDQLGLSEEERSSMLGHLPRTNGDRYTKRHTISTSTRNAVREHFKVSPCVSPRNDVHE